LPLIDKSDGYSSVYRFFEVLTDKGHSIAGYVVMPNHVHLLLYYNGKEKSLNSLIGNGKRFMAYDIVKRLQQKGQHSLLQQLQNQVQYKDREKKQKHVVWEDGFDIKECRTEKFVLQKLIYMHLNPVSGKWLLAASSLEYLHSSSLFYFNGRQQLFVVQDYRELINWETM